MVHGMAKSFNGGLDQDPLYRQMLRVREDHARKQDHDYSHIFRKKSRFDLIRLSFIIMGIEFAYSAETAFVTPILLGIGVEHKHMTMVWGLSPILGFILSPILGTLSDRCRSSIGRRRPFIIILSVILFFGLILVPYGESVGAWFGDTGEAFINITSIANDNITGINLTDYEFYRVDDEIAHVMNFKYAIVFTIIGTIMLDFSADSCQTPARAYLLDVCLRDDQSKALSTFSILGGVGGSIGYALGGFNWKGTSFGDFLGGNIKTVFVIVTIIFVISFFLSIISFREIPLPLMEHDELLKPVTHAALKKERQRIEDKVFYIKEVSKQFALQLQFVGNPNMTPLSSQTQLITNSITALNDAEMGKMPNGVTEHEEDEHEESVSLMDYIKGIILMPKSMRILCLTNLLCWMSHLSYCLYFTDFVGEAVYRGDPAALQGSREYSRFEDGVRFGCWGMAVYSLACSFYALSIEHLIKKFRAKIVYVSGLLIDCAGMLIMAMYPTKWNVIIFSGTGGIVYSLLFTMPYLLIAQYHSKGSFKMSKGENVEMKRPRGLGTDIAIVGGMLFVAQIIISLGIGPFISLLGTTAAVIYAASLCSLLAACAALNIVYMDM